MVIHWTDDPLMEKKYYYKNFFSKSSLGNWLERLCHYGKPHSSKEAVLINQNINEDGLPQDLLQ